MISALVLLLFYLMMMLIISPSIYGLLLLQPEVPNKPDVLKTVNQTSFSKPCSAKLVLKFRNNAVSFISNFGRFTKQAFGFSQYKHLNINPEIRTSYSDSQKAIGRCTNRDISISQSRDSSTSGIPKYIVEIVNTCVSGCAPSNIHLHCGWFASARIVNPRVFKRLGYDDCLVKAGRPLNTSQIIRFTYSNSFMYPLGFKYAKFC